MNSKIAKLLIEQANLPSHTHVGFYPIFYVTYNNLVLCHMCANKLINGEVDQYEVLTADDIVDYGINWEDQDLRCANGHLIDSAIVILDDEGENNENK